MSDYKTNYKNKMNRIGGNRYERNMKIKSREFELYYEHSLNKEICVIDGITTTAIFQDHSQSNNKDLSDDKYVILPNSTKCGVGSYIDWRDSDWLVFTEEVKTIPTHQQLKIKVVNENLKWIKNGKICNNGNGWGAYVQNQTLYTLGVSGSGNYLSVVNAKMMMYMQNNEDTRALKIKDRIFIGDNVYQIMFADTVSRKGLINFLLEEDTMGANDCPKLKIADYFNSGLDVPKDDNAEDIEAEIIGGDTAKISKTYEYKISENFDVEEWAIESIEFPDAAYILEKDNHKISLKFKDDGRLIGTTVVLIAKIKNGGYISKPIRMTKKF